ncbi:MAG: hypothetical protein RLY20_2982 [Verrucomicrobiota bacterium]|jgi:uncharacterized protein YxjI
MEIKIECSCGTKFAFDVEPVSGRMPVGIGCPNCSLDATGQANAIIAQQLGTIAPPPAAAPAPAGLRLAGSAPRASAPPIAAAPAPTESRQASDAIDSALLNRTIFFVKERTGLLKLVDTYDIFDPATNRQIGIAKEEPPRWAKFLRLVVEKHKLPTCVNVYEAEGAPPVLSVHRGFTFLRSKMHVTCAGRKLGYFRSKLISIGGGFNVFDIHDQQVAEVKGNWKGWDFRFITKQGREIGTVTKKWGGLGRELFTSADNYIISLSGIGGANPEAAALLLAAGLSIDIVFKEDE